MNKDFIIKSVQNYLAAWNAKTVDERRSLLRNCMTRNAIYIDPQAQRPIRGVDGMQSLIEQFRTRFDHTLEPEGHIDMHHNVFRLQWRLQRDNGEILLRGLMIGDMTDTGVIERIVQFIDPT